MLGLTPNGKEVNCVCETLNYQYLSHGLGSETANIFEDSAMTNDEFVCDMHQNTLMCLSMVCPTWHTWGRCWRKEGDNLPQRVGT